MVLTVKLIIDNEKHIQNLLFEKKFVATNLAQYSIFRSNFDRNESLSILSHNQKFYTSSRFTRQLTKVLNILIVSVVKYSYTEGKGKVSP